MSTDGLAEHAQAPDNPKDGDTLTCLCGYVAVFTELDDGQPGEWIQTGGE